MWEISDRRLQLLDKIAALVADEHKATYQIVQSLSDIENDAVHIEAGYDSLYKFCTVELGYSEDAALRRIKAARVLHKYPKAALLYKEQKLSLTTIGILATALTHENRDKLLEEAAGKSKAEVLRLVARQKPLPNYNLRDKIKPLFIHKNSKNQPELPLGGIETGPDKFARANHPQGPEAEFEERLKISFYALPQFQEKINHMQRLLAGKYFKRATLEEIFVQAIDCYISHNCPVEKARRSIARRKDSPEVEALKAKKRPDTRELSRHIPADIKYQVMLRDGCRCTYIAPDGSRCNSNYLLEFDHIVPFAAGGTHTPENLRVLCRAHNNHLANKFFGKEHMQQFRKQA